MEVLIEFLDDRVISKGLWPPCSLDLSIPDFSPWGYLKNVPFKNNPLTLDELKRNILHAILDMKSYNLRKVPIILDYHRWLGCNVQSGRPIFDDFFQHLWPYIGNNTANVVFQMVKRLWFIRIDQ
ncbi:uncharacterized protein TNCV_1573841 [Trichonephila clavipes]|nr:uncharacterized protein TNCV_1573841 [Trichonephila clavipes]